MKSLAGEKCTGCESCVSICPKKCITMQLSNGFYYPEVNEQMCIDCKQCEVVCPALHPVNKSDTVKPSVYAAISSDKGTRQQSSSGGVFSLLAEEIIKTNGIVFGACFEQFSFNVVHKGITSTNELSILRGSKYVQSSINSSFSETEKALKNGKTVLFSGTPCQIAGLKMFLRNEYDKLFCIQVICHGVSSPVLWQKYVSYIEDKYSSVLRSFNFRDKETGWKNFSVSGTTSDGTVFSRPNFADPYMQLFLYNYSLRSSCFNCRFKGNSMLADITLGDFWQINNIQPDFNDNKGTSLVVLHTEKGKALFESISSELKSMELPYEKAIANNIAYNKSSYQPENYVNFKKDISVLPFKTIYKKYIVLNKKHTKEYMFNVLRAEKIKLLS